MAWSQKKRPDSEYISKAHAGRVLAHHGRVCHLCGHGDAEEVDHVIPWFEWGTRPGSPHDDTNLRPAHGQRCPTCKHECHGDKSKAEAARARTAAALARRSSGRRPPEPHPGHITQRDR